MLFVNPSSITGIVIGVHYNGVLILNLDKSSPNPVIVIKLEEMGKLPKLGECIRFQKKKGEWPTFQSEDLPRDISVKVMEGVPEIHIKTIAVSPSTPSPLDDQLNALVYCPYFGFVPVCNSYLKKVVMSKTKPYWITVKLTQRVVLKSVSQYSEEWVENSGLEHPWSREGVCVALDQETETGPMDLIYTKNNGIVFSEKTNGAKLGEWYYFEISGDQKKQRAGNLRTIEKPPSCTIIAKRGVVFRATWKVSIKDFDLFYAKEPEQQWKDRINATWQTFEDPVLGEIRMSEKVLWESLETIIPHYHRLCFEDEEPLKFDTEKNKPIFVKIMVYAKQTENGGMVMSAFFLDGIRNQDGEEIK